ncbi:MAG TPA: polysaccharide lyase family protein [Phycisphaerae bacterium]|nr:polysaccharide lyase family protein [Phycisphaerae bacterium]
MYRSMLLTLATTLLTSGTLRAQTVVFEIGKPDRNYGDLRFVQPQDYAQAFPEGVEFRVGESQPAADFSAIHPGPIDVWAGSRQHPFAIEFPLDDASGSYELKIDLVDTHGNAPPILRVDVNGSAAEQPLEPGAGDSSLVRPDSGKPRRLRYVLGSNYLKKGTNRIELKIISGSWLLYDAITLTRLPGGEQPSLELSVRPTMFFVEREGRILQELGVTVSGVARDASVRIDVRAGVDLIGTATLKQASLGTVGGVVYVDEADRPRQLTVTASAGGQTRTVSLTQTVQKKWHIFVAPSVHTDIGYTDTQDKVIDVHNRNTDLALELVREFPLYHWNLESSWAAQVWLNDALASRHHELYKAARERRIGIEASYLNMLSGLCTEEELIRNMYYSARLHRKFGVPFESYTITDAPSHVWSLPSILAGAGIRCLSVGVNQTRAPLFKKEIHKKSPFWWEGPDGARVLTWFAAGYSQAGSIGLNDGFDRMRAAVERDLTWWNQRKDYPYDAILLHGAYSDNVLGTRHIAETITEYAKHYAYPKVILCANNDFFAHIEKHFADRIPTVRGCGGSWWEDGAASTALETALNRTAHQDIIAAETAWAVAKQVNDKLAVPQERFDTAWDNILLYDEHTWGAWNSISHPMLDFVTRQWAVKAAYATTAKSLANRLLERGLNHLGAMVDAPAGSVLVFNPSGRPRTGVVEAEIPRDMLIVDEDGVVAQQITRQDLLVNVGVKFLARNVPAVGYRTYRLVPAGEVTAKPAPRRFDGKIFENEYYRVGFDPKTGGIASLIDKTLGKELVDASSPYKLGQLIYAAGGEEKKGETQWTCPNPNKIQFHSPEKSRLEPGAAGPVFSSVKSIFPMHMFPDASMEVVLYEHERRIDFNFRLNKSHTFDKEAVYFSFPFAGAAPRFRYEIGGSSVRPNEDHFPGACRDWFSVQRWVTVNMLDRAVAWSPVDTPLITISQMTPGNWLDELPITNGTLFAYAMNNYWFTNYKASQDGWFEFRYSLTSDQAIDPVAASLFGESVHAPMRTIRIVPIRGRSGQLPPTASFCSVEPANVTVTAVKPADDGKGVIVRLRETAGQATEARIVTSFPGTSRAVRCDLVERNREKLAMDGGKLTLKLEPNGMAAVRLE